MGTNPVRYALAPGCLGKSLQEIRHGENALPTHFAFRTHHADEERCINAPEYDALDPVSLLAQMKALQDRLWEFSWTRNNIEKAHKLTVMADDVIDQCDNNKPAEDNHSNRYYRTSKKIDLRRALRTWRTRRIRL